MRPPAVERLRRPRPWLAAALLLLAPAALAGRAYVSHDFDGARLTIRADDGRIELTLHGEDRLEVVFTPDDGASALPSFAIAGDPDPVEGRLVESATGLELTTGGLAATVDKDPLRISYRFKERPLIAEEAGFFRRDDGIGVSFRLAPDEVLFGGGSRVLGEMDRRGRRYTLYNQASYGYETRADLMYYSMPAVVSSRKYMLVFDNSARGELDIDSSGDGRLSFEAVGGRSAYLLMAGSTWPELAASVAAMTGRQPLLPRWALGNITSRMGYRSQQQVEEVVDGFIADDMPLDALVLDLYWFGPDLKGHMGNLAWDRRAFPDPEGMMRTLASKGVNTVLITEPFILTRSKRWDEAVRKGILGSTEDGEPFVFEFFFGETGLIDIFKESAREWFWDHYRRLTRSGVDGWWGDLGEPEVHPPELRHVSGTADELHNVYGHEWARLVYQGFREDFPERRLVSLMRSGFVGTQRYGILPWTGDVNRSWGGLKPQVELSLQLGLQGIGYMHSDLGGFAGAYEDAELYTRWLQYGVFQPVYRTHAQEDVPPEPIYWDDATRDIVRRYIKLRYQMLPYNYTLMFENATTGMPLMRPLFYLEDTPERLADTDAYLWGDAFLVAPVTEKGAKRRTLHLPAGSVWYDMWTGKRHPGGGELTVPLTIENIPVFIRAGSFVPLSPPMQHTGLYDPNSVVIHYFADPEVTRSSGMLYDDDGATFGAHEAGAHELIRFHSRRDGDRLVIGIDGERNPYPGAGDSRRLELALRNLPAAPRSIGIDDRRVEVGDSEAVAWDASRGVLSVVLEWRGEPHELVIPVAGWD